MKTLLCFVALTFSLPALAATPTIPSRTLVQAALKFAEQNKISLDAINDLKNLLSMRTLEEGETLSGVGAMLTKASCETVNDGFQCELGIRYCVERNEYPPTLNSIFFLVDRSGEIVNLTFYPRELSLSTCL